MSDVPITVDGEALPFEQQAGEGEEAYEAFSTYRDMGADRSTAKVARVLGKSKTLMDRWSSAHGWQKRVFAYDSWLDRQRREALAEAAQERGRKQAEALDAAITVLAEPAIQAARLIADGKLQVNEDTPAHLVLSLVEKTSKVLPSLIQAARLVNGESTENVNVRGQLGTAAHGKSDEDLERMFFGVDDGHAEPDPPALPEGE